MEGIFKKCLKEQEDTPGIFQDIAKKGVFKLQPKPQEYLRNTSGILQENPGIPD